jgi:hypothetical protein
MQYSIKAANEDILNQKIKRVMKQFLIWFDANPLVINTEKTTAPLFHAWLNRSFLKPQIRFNDVDIKYKHETKFLGLHLTENMNWDVHIKM